MQTSNPSNSGSINIEALQADLQQTLIHIDLENTFYTITPAELSNLEEGYSNIWKDVTLTSVGLGIPTIANALTEIRKTTELIFTTEVFLNSLIGSVSLVFVVIGGILWFRHSCKSEKLTDKIKQRPKYKI